MIADTRTYDKGKDTQLVHFKGKVTWVQVDNLNRFGNWSLNLYPDPDSLERLRELMLKNTFKKDEDGYNLQISRPASIEFQKGIQTPVTPPKTRMKDGTPVPERIGDGSDCTVTCELRKYKVPNSERWGNSIRLYGVTVDNLVPSQYQPPSTNAEGETETVW
jgi:hypothetical protein